MRIRGNPMRIARATWAIASALALSGCQGAFFGMLNGGGARVAARQTVTYSESPSLALDVYQPATTTKPTAVAVFFYGGSWRGGKRSEYAFVGKALAQAGILTLVADYRVFPQARFPAFEFDAARAVRWARDHAGEYGGDPQRLFVVGHSAGGHIAALLGTDARYLAAEGMRPKDLAGIVGIAGAYDFLPLTDPKLIEVFGDESEWPQSQPVNFVDGDEPPFLLLHGTDDRVVWPRNSETLETRLRHAGVPVTLQRYAGLGHFRIIAAVRFPKLAPTLADMAAFLRDTAPVDPAR